jgi:hypothetical protein
VKPLELDSEDYYSNGNAPLMFNVIDTSNLLDHVGALNILVATAPLLGISPSATLYTETLVKRAENRSESMSSFLCGPFPTISMLLGLCPVQYWAAATASLNVDEVVLGEIMAAKSGAGQMHDRLAWKQSHSVTNPAQGSTAGLALSYNEKDLAKILYKLYQEMFQHENVGRTFSNLNYRTVMNNSLPLNTRGAFAAFLGFIKGRLVVNWIKMMNHLIELIQNDSTLLVGSIYFQELITQLHGFGVYSSAILHMGLSSFDRGRILEGLESWTDMPPVLCVTLKVPRDKLKWFINIPLAELGTPLVHASIGSGVTASGMGWQNVFAMVHLSFGTVTTTGSRHTNDFEVHVIEDETGWAGTSPLTVSFYVPSYTLLIEPQKAIVSFGVQSTPLSTKQFMKTLGTMLNVYSTTLGDEENVFTSRTRPNQSGYTSICAAAKQHYAVPPTTAIRASIVAKINHKITGVVSFTGRIDNFPEDVKASLLNGAKVEIVTISPWIIAAVIDGTQYPIHFHAPVHTSQTKTRIARKSAWVEVTSAIVDPMKGERVPHFICPFFLNGRNPVVWNMPYLNLDGSPTIDRNGDLEWIRTHIILQFSARERKLIFPRFGSQKDARLQFKTSLFSLFMAFTGLGGTERHHIFLFNSIGQHRGLKFIVFVSCLRLDMANHTVVLDSAILPLLPIPRPEIGTFLDGLSGVPVSAVELGDETLVLWKEMITAYVERCRKWKHLSSCEYNAKGSIPLSIEPDQQFLCSCGKGEIPSKFVSGVPRWDIVSEHAFRAAISPMFANPFIELIHDTEALEAATHVKGIGCRSCGKEERIDGKELLRCSRCKSRGVLFS